MNYKKTEINFHCRYVFETKKLIDLIILGRNRFEDDKIDSKKRNTIILPKINKQTPNVFKYFSVSVSYNYPFFQENPIS